MRRELREGLMAPGRERPRPEPLRISINPWHSEGPNQFFPNVPNGVSPAYRIARANGLHPRNDYRRRGPESVAAMTKLTLAIDNYH